MRRAGKKRRCRRWVRYHYLRLLRLNDTPEKVAGGLAMGVVIGVLPTFGLGVILAIFLAGPLRLNKAAAIIGTLVVNPWVAPFFWALSYFTGSLALGYNLDQTIEVVRYLRSHTDVWENIFARRLLLPYVLGNIMVTAASAAFFYVAGLLVVREYKKAKRKRLLHRRNARDHNR